MQRCHRGFYRLTEEPDTPRGGVIQPIICSFWEFLTKELFFVAADTATTHVLDI